MGKLYNRVKVAVSGTPGTGAITLGSASSGYQSFSQAGVANSDVVSYVIEDGNNYEYGQGTYSTTGPTLTRTTIQGSYNGTTYGTSAISVTSAATVMISALTSDLLTPALANTAVSGFKTATFNSQTTIATTTGSITIDWTSAQNQKQTEPTGSITYTFTAPPGPCHLQLLVDSDGTSTAQTFTWPGTVIWLGSTWAAAANKKAIINFWYDGSSYYAMGTNQV